MITRIWATPKLRASMSSPYLGRSSLHLVWAQMRYRRQYVFTYDTGFIVTFLTHTLVTWKVGVKQMLVYIINVYLILNYADPSSTSSDIVSADSDGKETDVTVFAMSIRSNFLLNSSRFSRLMQYTVASSSL